MKLGRLGTPLIPQRSCRAEPLAVSVRLVGALRALAHLVHSRADSVASRQERKAEAQLVLVVQQG